MTIKEKMIKIIDIILDEKLMYKDSEVLSLPIIRFKEEGIYADEFSRIMEKLTYEGCLISEEDFDICNFDPTYIYHFNYAMVRPNYEKFTEYNNQLKQSNNKIRLQNLTTGKHKIYIKEKLFTDIKRIKKDIILLYFAERYKKSKSIKSDDFFKWCNKRYPDIYKSAETNFQGTIKWFNNGINHINEDYKRKQGKKNLITYNKNLGTFDITEKIVIKTY